MATPTPKTLAIFIHDLGGGGAERIAVNLANQLHANGHRVLLATMGDRDHYGQFLDPGVARHRLPRRAAAAAAALRRLVVRERVATVLANVTRENLIAALACLGLGARLIAIEHNNLDLESMAHRRTKRFVKTAAILALYRRLDALVCVSEGVAAHFRRRLPGLDVRAIHNPVFDARDLERAAEPTDLDGRPYIIGVGRLSAQKNFALLLRAYALLARAGADYDLVLLGEGEQRADLERLARELGVADRARLIGFRDNPYSYIARARALVMSSAWEGFGNVLVEALAVGTRIVSVDCPYGPAEIIARTAGTLVRSMEPEDLARGVERELAEARDPGELRAMAGAFTVEAVVRRYEELI